MTVRVITAPAVEPVSLAEARMHLRETASTAQDPLIMGLITAARQYAENYTRRALITQELELTLPRFPLDGIIRLPRPPLQSITHVKYIDVGGVLQTVLAADYQADTYVEPGELRPAYLSYWQGVRLDYNAVQVRYIAGYAPAGSPLETAGGVPEQIKTWIKMRVAQLYENREGVVVGNIVTPIPRDFVDGLLDAYIVDLF